MLALAPTQYPAPARGTHPQACILASPLRTTAVKCALLSHHSPAEACRGAGTAAAGSGGGECARLAGETQMTGRLSVAALLTQMDTASSRVTLCRSLCAGKRGEKPAKAPVGPTRQMATSASGGSIAAATTVTSVPLANVRLTLLQPGASGMRSLAGTGAVVADGGDRVG